MHKATMSRREAAKRARIEERDGLCGICPAGCWVTVTLEAGRIAGVRPQDHPLGMICTNGAHSSEIVHDPDRLQYPMRRVGLKGTHEFERIGWDDAFEIIVENLSKIRDESGPEATAIYTGRGSFELALCDVFQPAGVAISSASSVLFPFGSPNTLGVGALCYVSFAMIAPHVTFGEYYHTMDHDIENAELIVIWGANPGRTPWRRSGLHRPATQPYGPRGRRRVDPYSPRHRRRVSARHDQPLDRGRAPRRGVRQALDRRLR
jgi:anaerobic selenocysteine-containing dehydrogenase